MHLHPQVTHQFDINPLHLQAKCRFQAITISVSQSNPPVSSILKPVDVVKNGCNPDYDSFPGPITYVFIKQMHKVACEEVKVPRMKKNTTITCNISHHCKT